MQIDMIAIIDYGMGNVGSIQNMLTRLGATSVITSDPEEINSADRLILPGVGAFDRAMQTIKDIKLYHVLEQIVQKQEVPILGICLGMQLLTNGSEEGSLPGFGWINAITKRFNFQATAVKHPIPHMGWNYVNILQDNSIFKDMYSEPRFYFVHSYFVECANQSNVLSETEYGIPFHSAIVNGNVFGTQFHPEKSHKYGLKLLENFTRI